MIIGASTPFLHKETLIPFWKLFLSPDQSIPI